MKRFHLHNPNVSLAVLRRRLTADLIDMISLAMEVWATRGRTFAWNHSYPRMTAYNQAVYRLCKAGLIARRDMRGGPPTLSLTATGQQLVSDDLFPERYWHQHWNGRWYLLLYDIPETQRHYRRALNYFFRQTRMGCLQKSVYVSVRDIRPLFHDLEEAAALGDYANIFEAQTVLGHRGAAIVARAWNMERLQQIHSEYLQADAKRGGMKYKPGFPFALATMREEMALYRHVMRDDPLLPKALWPADYLGPKVVTAFRRRVLSQALQSIPG